MRYKASIIGHISAHEQRLKLGQANPGKQSLSQIAEKGSLRSLCGFKNNGKGVIANGGKNAKEFSSDGTV